MQIINADSSTTWLSDYGKGCTENYGTYKVTYFGKNISTYKYTNTKVGTLLKNSSYYHWASDHYGSLYVTPTDTSYSMSTGSSTYTGESTYDTATQAFTGYNYFSDSSTYIYNKTQYGYLSQGKTVFSSKSRIVEIQSNSYTDGNNYYESTVTIPLVYDNSCRAYASPGPLMVSMAMSIPVSGHLVVKYKQDGVSGEFEIDYGSGSCDTLVTVFENGIIVVLDLKQNYYPGTMSPLAAH